VQFLTLRNAVTAYRVLTAPTPPLIAKARQLYADAGAVAGIVNIVLPDVPPPEPASR
jgi:hypothetical protein